MPRDPEIRTKLLQSWKHGCVFCGYNKQDPIRNSSVLEGAHIRNFCDNQLNDSKENIILLCPNHHEEYDRGLIDFDTSGTIYCLDESDQLHLKNVNKYPSYVPPGIIREHNSKSYVGKKLIINKQK